MFMPDDEREFVPRDQAFPLIVVYCLLLLFKTTFTVVSRPFYP